MRKHITRRMGYGFITTVVTLLGLITGASCGGNTNCTTLFAEWEAKVIAWNDDRENPEVGCPALEATLDLMESGCLTETEWQQLTGMTVAEYRQLTLDGMETLGCTTAPAEEPEEN